MTPLRLTLPLPPNRNRGSRSSGWAWYAAKKKWNEEADRWAALPSFPAPPAQPFARVTVSAVLVMPSPMDDDNALYRASKAPLDWLKTRGYIVDDSRKHVRWSSLPEQRITRSEPGRVEITIQEVAA